MRVLVISNVAWDTTNSYGNTLSNWFDEWEDSVFYNIYCRSSFPINKVCKKYYTVPPLTLIKNLLHPSKTGYSIQLGEARNNNPTREDVLIQEAKQGKKEWMYLLSDLVYSSGIWKTAKYKEFIRESAPDVVFSFGIADSFIYENYI